MRIFAISIWMALTLGSSAYSMGYVELCESKAIPASTKRTFQALLKVSGATSCQESYDTLSQSTEITLLNQRVTDFTPLAYFPKLKKFAVEEGRFGSRFCNSMAANSSPSEPLNLAPLAALKDLTSLRLMNMGIQDKDLGFLASLVKLKALRLGCNRISTIKPMLHLKELHTLYLSKNLLESISGISVLTKMWELSLASNRLTDIQEVQHFSRINYLSVANNRITKLPNLPTLMTLVASRNDLPDSGLAPGSFPNATQIILGSNRLTKVPDVGKTGSMRFLYINNNNIGSLDGIEAYAGMSSINVGYNPLSDAEIAKINGANLYSLSIDGTGITKLPDFATYDNLQRLSAEDNLIRKITDELLPNTMVQMFLARNRIESFRINKLPNLWGGFDVSNNKLREVTFDCRDHAVLMLNVSGNLLGNDGLHLQNCKDARGFRASNTSLSDVSFLAEHHNLKWLDLSKNPITDVSALKELENITEAELGDMALGTIVEKTASNCPKDAKSPVIRSWCSVSRP